MATKIGFQGQIKVGPTSADIILSTVRDVSIKLSANTVDDTSRGTLGWKSQMQGLNSWSLEFEMIYDPSNAGWVAVRDAFWNHTSLLIEALDNKAPFAISGDELNGIEGTVFVTGFDKGEPLEDVQTSSIVLAGSGTPVWLTNTVA